LGSRPPVARELPAVHERLLCAAIGTLDDVLELLGRDSAIRPQLRRLVGVCGQSNKAA
jgi:hypothetical protein